MDTLSFIYSVHRIMDEENASIKVKVNCGGGRYNRKRCQRNNRGAGKNVPIAKHTKKLAKGKVILSTNCRIQFCTFSL